MKQTVFRGVRDVALVGACAWLTTRCGGAELVALQGEPATVAEFTTPATTRSSPAVDGVQQFVVALQRDDGRAWGQLSEKTRNDLSDLASTAGLRGPDLLRLKKLPVNGSLAEGTPFDPLTVFAMADIQSLQLVGAAPKAGAVIQNVEVTSTTGQKRTIEMRWEPYAWRIHHPLTPAAAQP